MQYIAEKWVWVENQLLFIHQVYFIGIHTNCPGNNLIDITISHPLESMNIYFLGGILEMVYFNAILTYQMSNMRLKDVTSILS